MAIPLHTHARPLQAPRAPILGRITRAEGLPRAARPDSILIASRPAAGAEGFAAVLLEDALTAAEAAGIGAGAPAFDSLRSSLHLEEGDVVAIQPGGYVRTLYRVSFRHNAIFATERCNSYCLMCSQPPREVDDRGRVAEHLRLLELIDPACTALGITGGEPTLLGSGFLEVIAACKTKLPQAALHVLSNGRAFADPELARQLAQIGHPDLVIAVPLYSARAQDHDHVVQVRGAFEQAVRGIRQLGRQQVRVEIRVVLHRLTFRGLPQLAAFIYRNLTFADHVALMGLEIMGFAWPNLDQLWIDPHDYAAELAMATSFLAERGIPVSIYNLPLCLLPRELWPFSRQSISDWKNDFLPCCDGCSVKSRCGGFFSSSLKRRYSSRVAPIPESGAGE